MGVDDIPGNKKDLAAHLYKLYEITLQPVNLCSGKGDRRFTFYRLTVISIPALKATVTAFS